MGYCANCGKEISDRAAACPNCGHPHAGAGRPPGGSGRTDGNAIASLILGIAGLVMCPLVPSIFAVVLGNKAKERLAREPGLEGEGLAKAGVVLGWVGIAIGSVVVLALLAAGGGLGLR